MKVFMLRGDTEDEIKKETQIVAAAGNLSRASGTVSEVFNKRDNHEKNVKLAGNVFDYGHTSIAEHGYINLGLENVSVLVEQVLIGYRLTAFTIKSRRNVDFRTAGYKVPDFKDKNGNVLTNNEELQKLFVNHYNKLFAEYGKLVDEGIPIEECRYVLPYGFYSNIIMSMDDNEFYRMTCDFSFGKYSNIPELCELGQEFENILLKYKPYLVSAFNKEKEKAHKDNSIYEDQFAFVDKLLEGQTIAPNLSKGELLEKVNMIDYTKEADYKVLCSILMNRYQLSFIEAGKLLEKLREEDPQIDNKLMQALIHSKNQRELEQVSFTFEIPIELAVLTHITRHRMHSLLIPDFTPIWNLDNYVIPDNLKGVHEEEYRELYADNKALMEYFKSQGVRDEDLVYFYLSGNACNIMTTMNGRTLEWISRKRCCNKAQTAIRRIANQMVAEASEVAPLIGTSLGAPCKVEGYCPEGADSCKNRGVVVKGLKRKDS